MQNTSSNSHHTALLKEKEFYELLRVIAFWTIPTGDEEFFKLTTSWEEY